MDLEEAKDLIKRFEAGDADGTNVSLILSALCIVQMDQLNKSHKEKSNNGK